MLRDQLGNELSQNDMVSFALAHPQAIGNILEIKGGGLITGRRAGGAEQRPGVAVIICRFEIPFDPARPILGNAVKVYNPQPLDDEGKPQTASLLKM